jgi:branched-chain amino acid transport system ATP-binding protein
VCKSDLMLQLNDVHAYYGDSYILQGVSLQVPKGSVVALLGRNGMGKTTTIRSIVGFTPARRGTVLFKETDITHLEPYRIVRMGVGLVPQGRRVFASLSVKENLMIGARPREDGWDLERVLSAFPRVEQRLYHQGNALSGGEQQMVAIARALMGNPELVLMDEPSEGLSPLAVQDVGKIIRKIKEDGMVSILIVEQNLKLAFELADYVYVMSKGRIVHESAPEELKNDMELMSRHLGV